VFLVVNACCEGTLINRAKTGRGEHLIPERLFYLVVNCAVASSTIVAALVVAATIRWILGRDPGTGPMKEIAAQIRRGAKIFLWCEWRVLMPLVLIVALALWWHMALAASICFLAGAACSALAGAIGMTVATSANVRTANAARRGTGPALGVAFAGGTVMGLTVSALGLAGITVAYMVTRDIYTVACFAMGASLVALLTRVGGAYIPKRPTSRPISWGRTN